MIFTFYSYKGGVGRSMALANVASWFFLQGARVVMIDWDLEAPGLEAFFYQSEQELNTVRTKVGLMDLLLGYRQQYASAARSLDSRDPAYLHRAAVAKLGPIHQWLHPICAPEPSDSRAPGLWLLSAGERHDSIADYAESVHDFDWAEFYADYEGEAFFEWLRRELAPEFNQNQLVHQAHADVVLIDSRTGITEMGGVCTQQLGDVVVAFSAPNLQNLLGVETMARSFRRKEILESRQGKPDVIIVPSRVDASELESRNRFEKRLHQIEAEFIPSVLQSLKRSFWDLKIPYVPKFAYEEALSIRNDSNNGRYIEAQEMATAYRLLGATLVMLTPASHPLRSYSAHETTSLFERRRVYLTWAGLTGTSLANGIVRKFEAEAPDIDLWLQQRATTVQVSDAPMPQDVLFSSAFLVAVSPEALESDWIRREWQQARRNGACIYGVYATGLPSILPRWMRRVRLFEINAEWDHLLQTLRAPCLALRAPFMAPDLPAPYVERPQPVELLRSAVFGPSGDPVAGRVVIRGIGGSGKSVLAAAFCREPAVVERFDDGILWITLGPKPQIRDSLTQLYAALTGERPAFANEQDASYHLGTKLGSLQCLIVLDDVWSPADTSAFFQAGQRSTWLVTARSAAVAPEGVVVGMADMSIEESVQLLVGALEVSYTPLALRTVARELGGLPLALSTARSLLVERVQQGDSVERASEHLLEQLKRTGLEEFGTIRAIVDTTVSRLPDEARTRFYMLESLPGQQGIPVSEAAVLWGVEEFDAESQVQQLARVSLVQFDPSSRTLAIHPVIRSYLRTKGGQRENVRRLTQKEIRALAEEMEQLLADRKRFNNLKPVIEKIDRRVAEIEGFLEGAQ